GAEPGRPSRGSRGGARWRPAGGSDGGWYIAPSRPGIRMNSKVVFPILLGGLAAGAFVVFRDRAPSPAGHEPAATAEAATAAAEPPVPTRAAMVVEPPTDPDVAARTIDGIVLPPEFFAELGPDERIRFTMPTGFR